MLESIEHTGQARARLVSIRADVILEGIRDAKGDPILMLKEVPEHTEEQEDEMQLYANDLMRELWKRVLGTNKPLKSAQEGDNAKSAIGASRARNDPANMF